MSKEREALLDIKELIDSGSYVGKYEMVEILNKRNLLNSVTYSCACGQDTLYSHVSAIPTCSSCDESFYITVKDFTI